MIKHKLLRKCISSFVIPIFTGTVGVSTITTAALIISQKYNLQREIPSSFLKLSEDGTELYGFKEGINQNDIYDYDTIKIPESVKTIKAFAFIYAFDDVGTNITKLVLNDNLETIESNAFAYCNGIHYVNHFVLGDQDNSHLEFIGDEAFAHTGIDGSIYFPRSLKHIGRRAFDTCTQLTDVLYFPNTIETIDSYAFHNCKKVGQIDLSEHEFIPKWLKTSNSIFDGLGIDTPSQDRNIPLYIRKENESEWQDCIFNRQALPAEANFSIKILNTLPANKLKLNDDRDELLGFADGFDTSKLNEYAKIVVPGTVKTINEGAFKDKIVNCRILIELTTVEKIKDSAFEGCTGLIGNIEPQALKEIGKKAFYGCSNIQNVVFSTGIEILSDEMFKNCSNLSSVTLFEYQDPGNLGEEKKQQLGNGVFANCPKLKHIHLDNFTALPSYWQREDWSETPFNNISKIGEITVANNFKDFSIWRDLLKRCGLDTINDVKDYDDSYCWDITYPKAGIFCPSKYLVISHHKERLMGLSDKGIAEKLNYNVIVTPNTVTSIYESAFEGQFPFTQGEEEEPNYYWRFSFNHGLREIQNNAFKNNDGLNGPLLLPNELEYLGNQAFANCKHLRGEFALPDSITHIGNQCFYNCQLLDTSTLMMPLKLTELGDSPFSGVSISNIVFQNEVNSFGHFCLASINNLSQINAKSWDYNTISQSTYFNESLYTTQTSGTFIVNNSATQQQWEDLLKTSMGLPAGWTIQIEGGNND